MDLKQFLAPQSMEERKAFAERCGTSAGHLRNVSHHCKPCAPELAIEIERESGRQVTCEELCPDVDWAYLRGTKKRA